MIPARVLGIGLGTLIALSGGIAQARESRAGLLIGDPVVAMPTDWQDPLSFVRTDSARNIFVASGHHVASFARNGKLIARWDVPDQVPLSNGLALDVSPIGGGPVASIDFDGATQLLLGARQQVYPATITSRAAPGCPQSVASCHTESARWARQGAAPRRSSSAARRERVGIGV